ncbi:N-acetyl-D-glucosamine ABC transport system [Cutibacterium acnes JCM 18909]|nr:N-acetyl-D-glucosamine ABC transport system [Cutibacterium acnes JCM 18909]
MNNNDFRHRWWLYLLLTITLLLVVLPFAWMVLGSIKPENELVRTQPTWWPHHPTLDNFHRLFSGQPWGKYLANSIVVSAAVTAGSLLFSSMLGYALARLNYPGKKLIFGAVMGCLMIPGLVMFIPQYVLIVNMGLANTLAALILPFLVQPFGAFLMRQFFLGIPRDLLEAGRIDGAGELTIFFPHLPSPRDPSLRHLGDPHLLRFMEQFPMALGRVLLPRHLHAARSPCSGLYRRRPDGLRLAYGRCNTGRATDPAGIPVLPAIHSRSLSHAGLK